MPETSKQVVAAYAKLHKYCMEKRIEYIVVREETGVYYRPILSKWTVTVGVAKNIKLRELYNVDSGGRVLGEVVDDIIKKYEKKLKEGGNEI